MPTLDRQTLAKQLAETYTSDRYTDPWVTVETYREYQREVAKKPNASAYKLAQSIEEPRGKVRAWKNGRRPFPVQAIEVAEQNDWLDLDWKGDTPRALNALVAWIFAGGSIEQEHYRPMFVATKDDELDALKTLLYTATNSRSQINERDESRAREVTIRDNATMFGRYLATLGAPVGEKNADRDDLSLPSYLDEAPTQVAREFVQIYVTLRGTARENLPTKEVQLAESRPPTFANSLRALITDVTLTDDPINGDNRQVFRLNAAAAAELDRLPEIALSPGAVGNQ